ncbi:1-phosphofructokinase [Agromyces rhizosphaerae]|uniref:1-phosphofructokinase n=2 Tax=Agromyces rhizosphaerae TaxID=88374 RepID=A0A9W6CVK8_9MICO|nr:1-phosphofructokinase [Agromyces rhizosphaerae]
MIVTLAVSPSLDVTYEVDRLHPGEITRPVRVTRVAGGKALNVARVARSLGADVAAVGALGGHTGAWIADLLATDGVETRIVPLRHETRTCSAIVETDGGASSTDLYERATPLDADEWEAFRATALEAAASASGDVWVAFSGSVPAAVDPAEVAALLAALRARGARIAVDSSGAALRALIQSADLVKVNRAEVEELLEQRFADASEAAHALGSRWSVDVVVTDGVRGGSALLAGTRVDLPPPGALGRFSAGSGDAFLGGFLAAIDRGADPAQALAFAADAAERNALVPGQGVLAERSPR